MLRFGIVLYILSVSMFHCFNIFLGRCSSHHSEVVVFFFRYLGVLARHFGVRTWYIVLQSVAWVDKGIIALGGVSDLNFKHLVSQTLFILVLPPNAAVIVPRHSWPSRLQLRHKNSDACENRQQSLSTSVYLITKLERTDCLTRL